MFLEGGHITNSTNLCCLYNNQSGQLLEGLSISEAQAVVMVLPKPEKHFWSVWIQGMNEWKPLSFVPELSFPLQRNLNYPELPKEHTTSQVVEGLGDYLSEESLKEYIDRQHERIVRRFNIIIERDGKQFKSHSINVSVGGVYLEDPVPDWVVGYCNITIEKPDTKEKIQLAGAVVDNQDPDNRVRLSFTPLAKREQESQLFYWLAA